MKKKKTNEELQSRREFFKKAAKGALPILGAIILAGAPNIVKAAEGNNMGCSGCMGTCSDICTSSCARTCRNSCNAGCDMTCRGGCQGYCERTCQGTCLNTCSGSCSHLSRY